jgi:hypothetical protein
VDTELLGDFRADSRRGHEPGHGLGVERAMMVPQFFGDLDAAVAIADSDESGFFAGISILGYFSPDQFEAAHP